MTTLSAPPDVTTPTSAPVQETASPLLQSSIARYALAVARIMVGWLFLWGFLDKTFGLGKSTPADQAWIAGSSPTEFFASKITYNGPFVDNLHAVVGSALADVLFMGSIAVIAIALTLGIGLRIAVVVGTAFLATVEIFKLWPPGNPFLTDHWLHVVLIIAFAAGGAGDTLGLGRMTRGVPWLR